MAGRLRRNRTVVVITGASSGIGRATAHAFAAKGARIVLAARSGESLEEVAVECRTRGGQAIAVPTDVADERQVDALVQAAVGAFGRIDVWVGNASVFSYGTFEKTPPEVFRAVLETNLLGQVNGARAVLPQFRKQGRGVLIFVGSVYAKVTSPYVSPYVTSKFGLRGFAEVLREELRGAKNIDVCMVHPATIDTPIYQHSANYTGERTHPLPPIVSAGRVARAIVRLTKRPRAEVAVGRMQGLSIPLHAVAPRLWERSVVPAMNLLALRGGSVPAAAGTVLEPQPATNRVSGGWRIPRLPVLVAAAALAATVLRRR